MRILITGANGFVGRNLTEQLKNRSGDEVLAFDRDTGYEVLEEYCKNCDFVYHLAGVNRPERDEDYWEGNFDFTKVLLGMLKRHKNPCPVMMASSIQAEYDNPYGKSKWKGERLLQTYQAETGAKVFIYRFSNIFGKWCRPNYNSVVATFCYNVARKLPIEINGRDTKINLIYIDDVVKEMLRLLETDNDQGISKTVNSTQDGFYFVEPVYEIRLGEIADLLKEFHESRHTLQIPDMTKESFSKKLYSTYLSYLPEHDFKYPLVMHEDDRGSFTEILRTTDRGQCSVNILKPGSEKGNHWHNTKNEKFVVVSGKARIQFRKPFSEDILNYYVSGDKIEVIDIPVGYVHNIMNEGDTDLVTLIWCNECFDPQNTDTYFLKVNKEK